MPIPVGDPADGIFINVPIVGGTLTGQINGLFVINKGPDGAVGTATLEIQPGSSGTYACFGVMPEGPVPLDSLETCVNGTGGQFFPDRAGCSGRGIIRHRTDERVNSRTFSG